MSFINVLEQILDCTNVVADLNVDVCPVSLRREIGYPFTSITVSDWNLCGYYFLHLFLSMHGALGNAAPHGPCIMHLVTVLWANLFVS